MTTAAAPRPRRAALLRAAVLPAALAASLVLVPLPAAYAAGPAAAVPPAPTEAGPLRIHDIQGTTRTSPQAGKPVTGVPGTVTGVRAYGSAKGFWMQDPNPDADPATSEGIFVYTGAAPTVRVGDSVLVSGKVTEYYPNYGGGSQSVTELTGPAVTVLSSGNPLPAPVVVDTRNIPGTYTPPAGPDGTIDQVRLNPEKYALDFYESLEGMLVQVRDARVVQATDKYNELWVAADRQDQRSKRGGVLYESYREPNVGRLMVQQQAPASQQPFPVANVGDELTGATTGPLDYNQFGGYTLVAGSVGALRDNHLQREVTAQATDRELTVATYNVENLAATNPDAKFAALAQGVVTNLRSPDIVALEEIQDDNGSKNDGTVGASRTIARFVDAVKAAGGPAYEWRSIDPQDGKDGGEPGGNIRQVFLFNPQRVSFTDIPGGTATTAVAVTGTGAATALTASPGRIEPTDEAWTDSRKPLVGQFTFRGRTVFVIANHFNSKGGDQGIDSRFQAPTRSSEVQRIKQATVEQAFVGKLLAADQEARIVAVGDYNDYQFSPALAALTKGGVLRDLVNELPETEQYSYVYQGNSQVLDHILVSPELGYAKYDVVHINAEFAQQASDHDPQVVRLKP